MKLYNKKLTNLLLLICVSCGIVYIGYFLFFIPLSIKNDTKTAVKINSINNKNISTKNTTAKYLNSDTLLTVHSSIIHKIAKHVNFKDMNLIAKKNILLYTISSKYGTYFEDKKLLKIDTKSILSDTNNGYLIISNKSKSNLDKNIFYGTTPLIINSGLMASGKKFIFNNKKNILEIIKNVRVIIK